MLKFETLLALPNLAKYKPAYKPETGYVLAASVGTPSVTASV